MGPCGHQAQELNKINETFTEHYISKAELDTNEVNYFEKFR